MSSFKDCKDQDMAQLDVLGGGQSENCDRYFDTFDISVSRFNLRISMFVVHAAAEICLSNVKILVSKLSFSPI